MIKIFSKRTKNQKGFTLVELIVVIAILGILGAIAVPRFSGFRESAAEKADRATAAVLANAARLYYIEGDADFSGDDITLTIPENETTNIPSELEVLLEDQEYNPQKTAKDSFTIIITKEGNVTVTYTGGEQLYPVK